MHGRKNIKFPCLFSFMFPALVCLLSDNEIVMSLQALKFSLNMLKFKCI